MMNFSTKSVRVLTTIATGKPAIASSRTLSTSMPFAYRKYKSNAEILAEAGVVEPNNDLPGPIRLRSTGGLRMWELSHQRTGNLLSPKMISQLRKRIELIEKNETVNAGLFFCTDYDLDPDERVDIFCKGVDPVAIKKDKAAYVKDVQSLASKIANFDNKKNLIAVYGGLCNGTGYAVFAGSKYRLSTSQTKLVVDDLLSGQFPIGALPYYFIRGNQRVGLEFARYAAVCGASFTPSEMFSLGLISHITQDDVHEAIFQTYGRSMPYNLFSSVQQLEVHNDILDEALQQMHIGSNFDVMDDPIFDKVMIVRPQEVRVEDNLAADGNVKDISDIVKHCFATDDANAALQKLKQDSGAYPVLGRAHANFAKLNKKLAQEWFDFTRSVENSSLVKTLETERKYLQRK